MTELERRLIVLGHSLAVPESPDVAPRVLAHIGTRVRPPARQRRRLVLALAALAIAALLATLAIPDARSALLRFFRIGGERIELVDQLPPVAPLEFDIGFALGERVSLEEARRIAGNDLLELEERPDAVYLGPQDTIWFLYGSPDAVRLLVAQTPKVDVDEPFILKKLVESGTRVEPVMVRGNPAYLLSGEPHVVLLVDELGVTYPESARLARDVLVWEEDGRTIRLEGDLSREEALDIAESLR